MSQSDDGKELPLSVLRNSQGDVVALQSLTGVVYLLGGQALGVRSADFIWKGEMYAGEIIKGNRLVFSINNRGLCRDRRGEIPNPVPIERSH